MRPYGRIYQSAWKDDEIRSLTHAAFRVFVYLVTGCHWSCIVEKSDGQIARGVGNMKRLEAREALAELVSAGLVDWDDDADVVWVVNGMRYQISSWNMNLAKNLDRYLGELPISAVVDRFRTEYENGPEPKPKTVADRSEDRPSTTPTPTPTETTTTTRARVAGLDIAPGSTEDRYLAERVEKYGEDEVMAVIGMYTGTVSMRGDKPRPLDVLEAAGFRAWQRKLNESRRPEKRKGTTEPHGQRYDGSEIPEG